MLTILRLVQGQFPSLQTNVHPKLFRIPTGKIHNYNNEIHVNCHYSNQISTYRISPHFVGCPKSQGNTQLGVRPIQKFPRLNEALRMYA